MLVVSDYPAGVGWAIAMRCPASVNHAFTQGQACPLQVVHGIEDDVAVGTVGTCAWICGNDFYGSTKFFSACGEIKSVQPVKIESGRIPAHCHNVDCPVRPALAINSRRSSYSDYRRDCIALICIRR